jgi:uncharacterized flavoprotein (TIGR03862 family)
VLRAWIARLRQQGVEFRPRHEFSGWDAAGALLIGNADGVLESVAADADILALGGASWPRLGSDGGCVGMLASRGIAVRPLIPANCGFSVAWSPFFREGFAGKPLKNVALRFGARSVRGEATIAAYGIEGGAVYALSATLREALAVQTPAVLTVDLCPDIAPARTLERLAAPRRGQSTATFLRKALGLTPVAINLLREAVGRDLPTEPGSLARLIHALPIRLQAAQPIARAISSAGGVALRELDAGLMLKQLPGTFLAGEMLDWEAPTGGYLLQASFATGHVAGRAALAWSAAHRPVG